MEPPINIFCCNNETSRLLVSRLGITKLLTAGSPYLRLSFLNMWCYGADKLKGLLLYPEDLEILVLLPTEDSRYVYINQLKLERAEPFNHALKE